MSKSASQPGNPSRAVKILQPVILVLVVYLIFTVDLLLYYQWDISCLVHAGQTYVNPAATPKSLCLKDEGDGYDGQFNYRFALNPFSNKASDNGITIDMPRYRYQRIFYSLVAWALTGGNPVLVPYVFVLLNLLAILALTVMSAAYALSQGRNSHWGLLVGLYLGFLLNHALDLGGILEIGLLFAALQFLKTRDWVAVLLLACAILTRETAVLFAGAILIQAFLERWSRWSLYLLPVGVFVAWQVFVQWFWRGVPDLISGSENVGLPFVGYVSAFINRIQAGDWFGVIVLVVVLAFGIGVLVALKNSPAPLYVKLAWLLYSGLAMLTGLDVWIKFNGYLRGLAEWFFLSCLIIIPVVRLPFPRRSPQKKSLEVPG